MITTSSLSKTMPMPKKRANTFAIVTHTLSTARMLIVTAGCYNLFIAIILVALYPTMSQANLSAFLNAYLSTGVVAGLLGGHMTHVSGFTTFLALYAYSAFNAVLYAGILAYIGGTAIPLNIENGMLDLMLARPIGRVRYYLETWCAIAIATVITSLFTLAFTWGSTFFVAHPDINWQWLTITQLVQLSFYFLAGSLGLLLGSFINTSRAAAGTAAGLVALTYLLNTFGNLSSKFNWLLKITPFYYAPSIDPLVQHQLTWWHPWVLVLVGLVFGIVGLAVFARKDLPTV
jgi:ABC-2 type transport system permease protein